MTPTGPAWLQPCIYFFAAFTHPAVRLTLIGAIVLLGFAMRYCERPRLHRVIGVVLGVAIATLAASLMVQFLLFTSSWTF